MVSTLYMKLGGSFSLIKYTHTQLQNPDDKAEKKKNRRKVNIYSAVGNKVLF